MRDPLWKIKDRIVAALATCSLQEISADLLDSAAPPATTTPLAFTRGALPGSPQRGSAKAGPGR